LHPSESEPDQPNRRQGRDQDREKPKPTHGLIDRHEIGKVTKLFWFEPFASFCNGRIRQPTIAERPLIDLDKVFDANDDYPNECENNAEPVPAIEPNQASL
jgi:hypothetical protein